MTDALFAKSLLVLIMTATALMASPGPATLSLAAVGAAFGARRARPYLTGIIIGTTLVLAIVASGLTATILAVPALGHTLVVIGAVYIVHLAWKIANAPLAIDLNAPPVPPSLGGGLMLAVTNPKAYFAIGAVFASVDLFAEPAMNAASKAAVLTAMIVVINVLWTAAGSALPILFQDRKIARMVNLLFAVTLVASSLLAIAHGL